MQLARYWSKVDSTAQTPRGKSQSFSVWRGSALSRADAERLARAAAERVAQRIENGEGFPQRYAYADRPLREDILEEIADADGTVVAAITRNVYGAEILNATRLLFIDVDLLEPRTASLFSLMERLLGGLLGSRRKAAGISAREAEAHARRRLWLEEHPEWGIRVYRTRSGLRYLVTHALFEPGGPASEAAMQFVGCDAAYVALCRSQRSFRARLTPKPWRCGIGRPRLRFPFQSADEERQMRAWLEHYNAARQAWATCAFIEASGNSDVHPDLQPLLQIHDERSGADSGLPLA